MRALGFWVVLAIMAAACDQAGSGTGRLGLGELPDAGPGEPPLTIQTRELLPARSGLAYTEKVTAVGIPPLTYALPDKPAELAWLTIDPDRGILRGVPPPQGVGERSLTVEVTDGADPRHTARQVLTLRITECDDGASEGCYAPSTAGCVQGARVCKDGRWGACQGTGSTDVNACGPGCAVCGPGALACKDGRCACGGGAACSGQKSICCPAPGGGACTDVLRDPDACGACGNVCNPGDRRNVARVCSGGACQFPCSSGRYFDCDQNAENGCEADLEQSPTTCGSCAKVCAAPGGGWGTCSGGSCGQACPEGTRLCPTNSGPNPPANTCYPLDDSNNCGGCGRVCPAAPPNAVSGVCTGGTCKITCLQWYADCDSDWSNGCETYIRDSREHCGGCNVKCTADGGTAGAFCVDGACVYCEPCGNITRCCAPNICDRSTVPPQCIP